ncbi:hypothetical protein C8Q74DRAFT_355565 [Fomes fomentarius]|nr:hypothetical protein C8Q74DRAFT_355565 [Fomes fomentarius]
MHGRRPGKGTRALKSLAGGGLVVYFKMSAHKRPGTTMTKRSEAVHSHSLRTADTTLQLCHRLQTWTPSPSHLYFPLSKSSPLKSPSSTTRRVAAAAGTASASSPDHTLCYMLIRANTPS